MRLNDLIYENDTLKFFNHEEGRVVMTGSPEYQYHLKDHLGNIRVTITAKPVTPNTFTTNFEAGTNSDFNNYHNHNFDLVDHTDEAGTTYTKTQLLNGTGNYRVGLAKSFSVMPGDVVTAGAYLPAVAVSAKAGVKYMNLSSTANPNVLINSLAAAFGVSSGSTGEALKAYNGLNSYAATVVGGDHPGDNETPPKAFVTILFFDKDYNLLDAAWDQVTTTGEQSSGTTKQPPHDLVQITATAKSGGYAYVFLSNEHPYLVDVYFDDATFSVTPTPVVQTQDYYPFGLAYSTYLREDAVDQGYQFNGNEVQDELDLGWIDYGARMYLASIGRFAAPDKRAHSYLDLSPYAYVANNPVNSVDFNGDFILPKEFLAKFQRLAQYLSKGIQGILNNPKVVAALKKHGGFSDQQLEEVFTWGQGPTIQPSKMEPLTEYRPRLGQYMGPKGSPSPLYLNEEMLERLESAEGKDRDYWLFLVAATILHETTHYGYYQNGVTTETEEEGNDFDKDAYGKVVRLSNYREIFDKWQSKQPGNSSEFGSGAANVYKAGEGSSQGTSGGSSGSNKGRGGKKPDADKKAAKRSGGAH